MRHPQLLERIKALTEPIRPEPFDHATNIRRISGIRCVAFDFYGTMFISAAGDIGVDEAQKSAHKRFFEASLKSAGYEIAAEASGEAGLRLFQDTIERHISKDKEHGVDHPEPDIVAVWEEVLTALIQQKVIEGPVSKDKAIRFAVEFEFRTNTIWPVPDLEQILNELLNRDLKLGIISNSQFYTPLAFEAIIGRSTDAFGFHPGLQKWSYAYGIKKPSLAFYRKFTGALPEANLEPSDVLYVGNDLFKDVIPAAELGMNTALYAGDRRSLRHDQEKLDQSEQKPDVIIDDLHQVLDCLG